MSVYEKNIQAFISLIESGLIPAEDWTDLNQFSQNLPEDAEEISAAIHNWLEPESRRQIREALKKRKKEMKSGSIKSDNTLGVGGSKSPTPANQPSPAAKDMIINHILRHSPPSTPQTNPPNTQGSN